ncbi:O-antigen ligase family protein [Rhizobium sp. RCAM05350]|nr:O-antigen ligase family protein [Rhizobium sp. RCAM05350]
MLPGILILAWVFERLRFLRIPIAVGGVALFNLFAVGSAVIRPLGEFITSLGIDATFTNRADIWRFAFTALAENPITGYGIKAFWQTQELVYSGGAVETWAVTAANGHNSYLDIALMTGIPGLFLTLLWVLFLPLQGHLTLAPGNRAFRSDAAFHPGLALCHLQRWPRKSVLRGRQSALVHLPLLPVRIAFPVVGDAD